MTALELKDLFLTFFIDKDHRQIPNSSLVPENDPTTLFISAGIQPLVPYFLGKIHPVGKRLVNVQQCVRTGDIDEVGNSTHHTFFEMLGNWSLGDYFKQEMIPWSFEFITQKLNISSKQLAVTVFAGDKDSPKDNQSKKIWQKLGIPLDRIAFLPKKNNWWGPPGITGPCGPDTEIFYWTGKVPAPAKFKPDDNLWVEIWNNVLIQYYKNEQGDYKKLVQNNIDTGLGVERTIAVLNGFDDNYLTDIWQPIIKSIEKLSHQSYQTNSKPFRIIADHIRASVFIVNSGIEPTNKQAGYVLRRLIRKAIRQAKYLSIDTNFTKTIASSVISNQSNYAGNYPELKRNKDKILDIIDCEEKRFRKTLDRGLKQINYLITNNLLDGTTASGVFQSFGFPIEMIQDEADKKHYLLPKDFIKVFNKSMEKHKHLSRTLSAGKFKSGLADNSEIITKYHTATHILHASLRQILGNHINQTGSNITQDRIRFDFSHPNKLSQTELDEVEILANKIISNNLPVTVENMSFKNAQKQGALAFFSSKYPDIVSVYTIPGFSKEVCTGPHVKYTIEIGNINIYKQESVGSGKRRIYAKIT